MSERSTMTVRESPASGSTTPRIGTATIHSETLLVQTDRRIELVDLTDRLVASVARVGVTDGIVSLWSMHTTCALFMSESQPALLADIRQLLETTVARDAAWKHNDPEHSDCDRMNADAHLRALLLGHGLTMQVSGGELILGQWQRAIMAELDGPRARTVRLQVLGIA